MIASGCSTLPTFPGTKHAPQPKAPAVPVVAPLPKPPAPPPPPALPGIKDLVGLTADDLTHYFGKPSVLRREPPAEVWHYVGPECVLHLFLYSDGKGGIPVVDHVEISERGPLLVEPAERRNGVCIKAFLKSDVTLPIKGAVEAPTPDQSSSDNTSAPSAAPPPASPATPAN